MRGPVGMAQDVCPVVSAEDRARLEAIVGDRTQNHKHMQRTRIVLLSTERMAGAEIGGALFTARRFSQRRMTRRVLQIHRRKAPALPRDGSACRATILCAKLGSLGAAGREEREARRVARLGASVQSCSWSGDPSTTIVHRHLKALNRLACSVGSALVGLGTVCTS